MEVITCDVSSYQVPVDDSYPHGWLIFRCCDGSYRDPNCDRNKAWCAKAYGAGRIRGWTTYVVYRPGKNAAILDHLGDLGPGGKVMIDAESFGGQLTTDHSDEINALADVLAAKFGRQNVWAYGNRGPDLAVWPRKPAWIGWVVAKYGGSKPSVGQMIGWQYTDGTWSVPGLPSSTAPFGKCDHNVLYLPDTPPPEDDMPYLDWPQRDRAALSADVASAIVNRPLGGVGYNGTVAAILAQILGTARTTQSVQAALVTLPSLISDQLKGLPAGTPVDTDALAKAVVTELSQRLDTPATP